MTHRTDFHDHVTPAQARVLFHIERLIGTAGRGKLHAQYLERIGRICLDARRVAHWPVRDCIAALQMLELTCRDAGLHLFRDISTGWRDFIWLRLRR